MAVRECLQWICFFLIRFKIFFWISFAYYSMENIHITFTNPYILHNRIRGGIVSIMNRLGTGQPINLGSIPSTTRSLLISKDCRLVLSPIQPPTQRTPWMFPTSKATATWGQLLTSIYCPYAFIRAQTV